MTFSGRAGGYVVAGAVALVVLLTVLHQIDGLFGGTHDAAVTAVSVATLRQHPALARWRAKLATAEARLQVSQGREAGLADSLRHLLASGRRVDTITVLREIATHDSTAYQQCSLAFRTCQQRAASAEAEVDSLTARLTAQVKVQPKRCWLSAGAGVAVGRGMASGAVFGVTCGLVRIPLLP